MKTLLIALAALLLAATTGYAASLTLTWRDNSTNESAFIVERSLEGESWSQLDIVPPDITSYTDATLEVGQTYYYRVRAVNEYGYSGYTNVASGQAKGTPADPSAIGVEPAAPTLRITVREDGTISIEPIAK